MKAFKPTLALILASLALLTACGGGGGSGGSSSGSVTTTGGGTLPPTYRQQIMALMQGSYSVQCTELASVTPSFAATLTITDRARISLSTKPQVDFNDPAAVFSVAPSYTQDGTFNTSPPGVAFLGKSGDKSIGANFTPFGPTSYQLAELFYQDEATGVVTTCAPVGAQAMATNWGGSALINVLAQGINGVLPCSAGGSVTLTRNAETLLITNNTGTTEVQLTGVRLSDLYQVPLNQQAPTSIADDTFKYTAYYLDGTKFVFSRAALGGVRSVSVTSPAGDTVVSCAI